jgi:hypothetical protein
MGRIYGVAGSSVIGNIFCGIAAYYAIAGYYGWNAPSQPHASGASAMLANSGHPILIILGLFVVGLVCSLPAWIAVYKSFYLQPTEGTPRSTTGLGDEPNKNKINVQHPADSTPSGCVLYTPTVTLGPPPQIFVTDINAIFGAYSREGFIRFKISVVACSTNLTLSRFVAGRISCRLDASNKTRTALTSKINATSALLLAESSIESANPSGRLVLSKPDATTFTIYRGVSVIVLKQHLSPAESASMSVALTPNRGLEFDFTDLTLSVTSPESGTERLALWDGIACSVGDVSSYRIKIDKTAPGLSEIVPDILSNS